MEEPEIRRATSGQLIAAFVAFGLLAVIAVVLLVLFAPVRAQ